MNKRSILSLLSVSGIAVSLLTSCHGNGNSNSSTNPADTVKTKTKADTANVTSTVMLPSPLQIGSIFKNAGLTYMTGLTNAVKSNSQYNSTYSEAVNMGVYGADLTYCVLNKQSQESLDYLKTLHALADKLGFGNVFEANDVAKRFQANLSSDDSLASIIADIQMDADTYLTTNNQKYVSTVTFAGAWVESMYIGSKVYADKKNENVSQRISEQMTILSNLLKALNEYKGEDPHIADMITSLKAISDTYKGYAEIMALSADSEQMAKLTDEHIAELGKKIQELRAKFIMS
jgi:hypothetical protein